MKVQSGKTFKWHIYTWHTLAHTVMQRFICKHKLYHLTHTTPVHVYVLFFRKHKVDYTEITLKILPPWAKLRHIISCLLCSKSMQGSRYQTMDG